MAIKFKDNDGEEEKPERKPEAAKPAKVAEPQPDPEPTPDGELPGLGLAKSEPKKRGRKKPFA